MTEKSLRYLGTVILAGLVGCQDSRHAIEESSLSRPSVASKKRVYVENDPAIVEPPAAQSPKDFKPTRKNCRELVDDVMDYVSRGLCDKILARKADLDRCKREARILGNTAKKCDCKTFEVEYPDAKKEGVKFMDEQTFSGLVQTICVRVRARLHSVSADIIFYIPPQFEPTPESLRQIRAKLKGTSHIDILQDTVRELMPIRIRLNEPEETPEFEMQFRLKQGASCPDRNTVRVGVFPILQGI